MSAAAARAKMQPQTSEPDQGIKMLDAATERCLIAYSTLNKFLQNFIDHVSHVYVEVISSSALLTIY